MLLLANRFLLLLSMSVRCILLHYKGYQYSQSRERHFLIWPSLLEVSYRVTFETQPFSEWRLCAKTGSLLDRTLLLM